MEIKYSKDFLVHLEKILKNNNNFSNKIEKIIFDIKIYHLGIEVFQKYNLKKLNELYYRLKIIPYRIIFKKTNTELIFDNIFIRKGKSDYKKYNK